MHFVFILLAIGIFGSILVFLIKRWHHKEEERLLEKLSSSEDINHEIDPEDYFEAKNNFAE